MLSYVDTRKIKNNRKYGFYFIMKKEMAKKDILHCMQRENQLCSKIEDYEYK